MTHRLVAALQAAATAPHSVKFRPLDAEEIAALADAPAPIEGEVHWQVPSRLQEVLAEAGAFSLRWHSTALGSAVELALFDAEAIELASEITYLPEGVERDGQVLSTQHLVPFAGPAGGDGEWAFCFDVSGEGPEYPVYYHHQDEPRARDAETGAWDDATAAAPDFASFEAWLTWVTSALQQGVDPEALGRPTESVVSLFAQSR